MLSRKKLHGSADEQWHPGCVAAYCKIPPGPLMLLPSRPLAILVGDTTSGT